MSEAKQPQTREGGERLERLISKARGWSDRDLHKYPTATLKLIDTLAKELEQAHEQLSAIDSDMDAILGERKTDDVTSILARTAAAVRAVGQQEQPASQPTVSLEFNLSQARALMEMFGGDDTLISVTRHEGVLKAWNTEYPDEGSMILDSPSSPTEAQ